MLTQLVLLTVAPFVAAFTYPDIVPLEKRQQPGTPQYDCHAACGAVITASRTENFCDSSNFTTSFDECLDCANEFDIWRYYGESVAEAGEACDLDATPAPANSTESASDAAAASTATGSDTVTVTEATSAEAPAEATAEATTTSSATESAESAAESAVSEPSEGAAVATSSEGLGFAVLPRMAQVGLGIGAAMLL